MGAVFQVKPCGGPRFAVAPTNSRTMIEAEIFPEAVDFLMWELKTFSTMGRKVGENIAT